MLTTHFGIMLDSLRSSRRIYDCNRNQKHKTNLANNREGAASMDEFEQDANIRMVRLAKRIRRRGRKT